ncbi:hypothetical protein AVEN_216013-1 [Araneus ventricosus]|uniref:Uncharacterized protein n=1 Tax=Araneus ventricosus TaxID=182803 RepID=A0A4Y2KLC7_ARAVE|nr:hypothetical protein AVEN_223418-1 [Araneus ventricosus]GBN03644.1 hypothetical protein AVEN_216013-1 [Araneus ventricosus]
MFPFNKKGEWGPLLRKRVDEIATCITHELSYASLPPGHRTDYRFSNQTQRRVKADCRCRKNPNEELVESSDASPWEPSLCRRRINRRGSQQATNSSERRLVNRVVTMQREISRSTFKVINGKVQ